MTFIKSFCDSCGVKYNSKNLKRYKDKLFCWNCWCKRVEIIRTQEVVFDLRIDIIKLRKDIEEMMNTLERIIKSEGLK